MEYSSLVAHGINIIKESHVVGEKYSSLYSLSVLQTFMVACQSAKSILCMFVKLCLIISNQQVVQDTLKGQILLKVCLHHDFAPPPGRKVKL